MNVINTTVSKSHRHCFATISSWQKAAFEAKMEKYRADPTLRAREIDQDWEAADQNKDGVLDYKEYMHAVSNHPVLVAFIKQENAPAEGKC